MWGLLTFILVYLFVLVVWAIVNVIFYALTIVFRKSLFYVPLAINVIFNWLVQIYFIIYPLYILWQIIVAKEWLILIGALLLGGFIIGFWATIMDFLVAPFGGITAYFSQKAAEKMEAKSEEFEYEYIAPDGKVIKKIESDDRINKKLAIFFLADYGNNLLYIFTHPAQYKIYGLLDYIFTPAFMMLQNVLMYGLVLGIYYAIRYKKFFYPNIKSFLTKVFIIDLIILIGLQLIAIIYFILLSNGYFQ